MNNNTLKKAMYSASTIGALGATIHLFANGDDDGGGTGGSTPPTTGNGIGPLPPMINPDAPILPGVVTPRGVSGARGEED